jgi:DNA-binding NarL/FixJ family response regulator
MSAISVLIVDYHAFTRYGIARFLEAASSYHVLGEVERGSEAIEVAIEKKPDLIIMGVKLPGMNGIETTRELIKCGVESHIILLSEMEESWVIKEALQAGVRGFVQKNSMTKELSNAIQSVLNDQIYLCKKSSTTMINSFQDAIESNAQILAIKLTPKESQVLQLIVEGYSTRDIANIQGVSIKTISTHRENIMEKLDIHSIAGLTKYAIREGMTSAIC